MGLIGRSMGLHAFSTMVGPVIGHMLKIFLKSLRIYLGPPGVPRLFPGALGPLGPLGAQGEPRPPACLPQAPRGPRAPGNPQGAQEIRKLLRNFFSIPGGPGGPKNSANLHANPLAYSDDLIFGRFIFRGSKFCFFFCPRSFFIPQLFISQSRGFNIPAGEILYSAIIYFAE